MVVFGWIVICIILASAVAGAIAACVDDEHGLGKEFLEGIYAIGYIFLPVAGIMASVPFLSALVRTVFGRLFALVGADPAIAATTFIAGDMGGFMLARELTANLENWITAMTVGFMAGSTIVFSIPVGLAMLRKIDHKYMALGVMAGLLSIPIGVLVANLLLWGLSPQIREVVATKGDPTHPLDMSLVQIVRNIVPLAIIMAVLALGLRLFPDRMIRLFMGFGRVMGILIKIVLVLCIVEYFSAATFGKGLFAATLGSFGFDPVIADPEQIADSAKLHHAVDEKYVVRALEVAGYIGIMLAGAFPMVYLIRTWLAKPIEALGRKIGLETAGATGLLAAAANILAMFRLIKDMRARDKVLCIAFSVCAAFTFGDHLAFTTNFQPNLLLPIMAGKLVGGVSGFLIAVWLCVPKAVQLEEEDMIEKVRIVLRHVPLLKEQRAIAISKLGGGLTNVIFKVDYEAESYVVRLFGKGTELLGIDRDREDVVSRAVAAAGVAPEVIACLPRGAVPEFDDFEGAAALRFMKGKLLEDADAKDPDVLRRIAATLKHCHAAPIDPKVGVFNVFAVVRDYLDKAEERNVSLPAAFGDARVLLARIEEELATSEPTCLCHNDLLAGNFIDDGTTMYIIDWEYGGRGDRFFDLGNFAVSLQMTEEQEKALLHGYFGEVRPEHLRRIKLMRLASDLRESSWGYLQSAVSTVKPAQYYLDYGKKHLDRFLVAAAVHL